MFKIWQGIFRLLRSGNYKSADMKTKKTIRAWLLLTGLSSLAFIAITVWAVPVFIIYNYGMMKYNRSDFAGAIPLLRRSVELDPSLIRSRSYLGDAFLREKRWSDANREYQIMDAAHVATGYDYYQWGYVLEQSGNIASARMRLQQGLSIAKRVHDKETITEAQHTLINLGSER